MNEFSPGVVGELGPLLNVVAAHQGDRNGIVRAIAANYERITQTPDEIQRLKRANNVVIGMSECGLFDLALHKLTDYGETLKDIESDSERNDEFATHLLRNRHGLELLEAAEAVRARQEAVTLQAIRTELRTRGFEVTENEGNASKIRLWMEPSGVVQQDWTIDEAVLSRLAGISLKTVDDWSGLTRSQRAFLLALKDLSRSEDPEWFSVSHIKSLCEAHWGREVFPEGGLRARVLNPLEQGEWIETRGKGDGRGGNAGDVQAKSKLLTINYPLSVNSRESTIPSNMLRKLNTPLEEIRNDLNADNTHTRGVALELLALRIARDIGLWPIAFRLRSRETQGAEVDLIAEGIQLQFSRWLFQCKNTQHVVLSDLAKEIGMATLLKAHVIVMVTTGTFRKTVRDYALGLAETTPLQAILIDGAMLSTFQREGAGSLIDIIRDQSKEILAVKRPQVTGALADNPEE